jgi:hypothetical protein
MITDYDLMDSVPVPGRQERECCVQHVCCTQHSFNSNYDLQCYSLRLVTAYGYYQTLKYSNSPCVRHKACTESAYVPENRSDVYLVRYKQKGAGYQEGGG